MVITASNAQSVLPLFASIQDLPEQQGLVYYRNVVSMTDRNNVAKGDTLVDGMAGRQKIGAQFAGEEIYLEDSGQAGDGTETHFVFTAKYPPVLLRSVTITIDGSTVKGVDDGEGNIIGLGVSVGTIDYENGSVDITFTDAPADGAKIFVSYASDFEKVLEIPTINTEYQSLMVKAKSYALRGVGSLFKEYAISKRFGIDAQEMLAKDLVQELTTEVSNGAIMEAYLNAKGSTDWDKTAPAGVSYTEHKTTFFDALATAESTILTNSGRFNGNSVLIAGTGAASIVRTLPGFKVADVQNAVLGTHLFGYLDGKPVIRSLSMPADEILLIAKGAANAYDSALVHGVYLPLYVSSTYQGVDHNPLTNQSMVANQSVTKAVVSNYITKIKIIAS